MYQSLKIEISQPPILSLESLKFRDQIIIYQKFEEQVKAFCLRVYQVMCKTGARTIYGVRQNYLKYNQRNHYLAVRWLESSL
jgi:hypothetical protein